MSTEAEAVSRRYFHAIDAHDLDGALACWRAGGREVVHGIIDEPAPDGVRRSIGGVLGALPDGRLSVEATSCEGERCAVQWTWRGTFAGAPFLGYAPTGARIELVGCDLLTVRDGLIERNDAYTDQMTFARQAGIIPADDSRAETVIRRAVNLRTRIASRVHATPVERVADGVWLIRGGLPRIMNVYLVADGDGVLVFDGGVRSMTPAVAAAGARLGGITRVVLGHGHADHRGVPAGLGVPVLCHRDEVSNVEGDGGYCSHDFSRLRIPFRFAVPVMMAGWDGGPVSVSGTLDEGDQLAGFRVVHLPGHTPGQIGLWREADRLAITSDCFYAIDGETGLRGDGQARMPHPAFTADVGLARASILKLAALRPAVVCPGHGGPVRGDVESQLRAAANS
jgi:glyoxylase-like metal-dependent hydrolase (beta-lactamase superfamily II)/predicted ester cyclase